MSELVRITPEQPQESPAEAVDQGAPAEIVLVEQEKTLEKGDINALQQKAGELHGMSEVQRGLELGIIGAGLQVMVDRYGAGKFLKAIQDYDEDGNRAGTFQGVIKKLAPEKGERKALYGAIKAEPMDTIAERFDQTLGGIAPAFTEVSAMERFRRFEMFSVEDTRGMKDGDGKRVWRGRATGGITNSSNLLLTGDFDNLLDSHPDLVENFRETNDTLGLLKGIRDIYKTEYAQFSTSLEQAKATIEEKVASGEAGVAELQTLSDDIYTDEIAKLEERLAGASSDAAREMVQNMLNKKAVEVTASREEFNTKKEAVRSKIVADLGANRLYGLSGGGNLAEPRPTYNDKEQHTA